jgi:hypothetical protein
MVTIPQDQFRHEAPRAGFRPLLTAAQSTVPSKLGNQLIYLDF